MTAASVLAFVGAVLDEKAENGASIASSLGYLGFSVAWVRKPRAFVHVAHGRGGSISPIVIVFAQHSVLRSC
jgi:hypothetical protein